VSINWGAWSQRGAAIRADLEQRRIKQGIGTLTPDEALMLFERILRQNPVQIAAARMEWDTFMEQHPDSYAQVESLVRARNANRVSARPVERTPSRMTRSTQATASAPIQPKSQQPETLLARLEAVPESHLLDLLREYLEGIARTVLGFTAGRRIDPQQPLQELGLDSLMAVEFRNALAAAIGRPLPATLLFSYPAIEDIAVHVARDLFHWIDETSSATTATEPDAAPVASQGVLGAIEDLSDEEVDRLFAQQLKGNVS
jgi:acyl carrier protein